VATVTNTTAAVTAPITSTIGGLLH
jgi:hypothetical protein